MCRTPRRVAQKGVYLLWESTVRRLLYDEGPQPHTVLYCGAEVVIEHDPAERFLHTSYGRVRLSSFEHYSARSTTTVMTYNHPHAAPSRRLLLFLPSERGAILIASTTASIPACLSSTLWSPCSCFNTKSAFFVWAFTGRHRSQFQCTPDDLPPNRIIEERVDLIRRGSASLTFLAPALLLRRRRPRLIPYGLLFEVFIAVVGGHHDC